jgi:hypothetical protein
MLSGILFTTLYLFARPNTNSTTLYLHGFLVHTAWELWQIAIGMSHPLRLTGGGNVFDICMDTALFMAGMWLTCTLGFPANANANAKLEKAEKPLNRLR